MYRAVLDLSRSEPRDDIALLVLRIADAEIARALDAVALGGRPE